jgi:hypothetical protein
MCGYRAKFVEPLRAGTAGGRVKRHMPPAFYRAAVVVLGALILGLLVLLVLKA